MDSRSHDDLIQPEPARVEDAARGSAGALPTGEEASLTPGKAAPAGSPDLDALPDLDFEIAELELEFASLLAADLDEPDLDEPAAAAQASDAQASDARASDAQASDAGDLPEDDAVPAPVSAADAGLPTDADMLAETDASEFERALDDMLADMLVDDSDVMTEDDPVVAELALAEDRAALASLPDARSADDASDATPAPVTVDIVAAESGTPSGTMAPEATTEAALVEAEAVEAIAADSVSAAPEAIVDESLPVAEVPPADAVETIAVQVEAEAVEAIAADGVSAAPEAIVDETQPVAEVPPADAVETIAVQVEAESVEAVAADGVSAAPEAIVDESLPVAEAAIDDAAGAIFVPGADAAADDEAPTAGQARETVTFEQGLEAVTFEQALESQDIVQTGFEAAVRGAAERAKARFLFQMPVHTVPDCQRVAAVNLAGDTAPTTVLVLLRADGRSFRMEDARASDNPFAGMAISYGGLLAHLKSLPTRAAA